MLGLVLAAALHGCAPGDAWAASAHPLSEAAAPPPGFGRVELSSGSFAAWVRRLPVQPEGALVRTWDGKLAPQRFYRVLRVSALPLKFRQDLEQCADWGFRLWLEYQASTRRPDDCWLLDYNGRRVRFQDWRKSGRGASLDSFFRWAASNANSHSLKKGLGKVAGGPDLMPGDLLVQNETGGIGHASVILDVAVDGQGRRVYLIGFGFMPAQDFHVEAAGPGQGRGDWFTLEGFQEFLTEHLPYGPPVLRRFSD
ncbi:MAG: hypothetical protein HY924_00090 [Elusimicrobia bacterium]|nr:hypothetical protein [Elusimicrobiota bacterium]